MKTRSEIQINYQRAKKQAQDLERIARDLRRMANNNLQDCISDISYNWTGDNAQEYLKKCRRLKENIEETARKIETTANTIKRVAKNIYDAEMRAIRILS